MKVTTTDRSKALPVLDECCEPSARVVDQDAEQLATMFRALADPARVKIMAMLLNADGVSARDVASGIGKSAATASHHLKTLRDAGLITAERRGTWTLPRRSGAHQRDPGRACAIRPPLTRPNGLNPL